MAPEAVRTIAEKALEASQRAELAAQIAKTTSENMVREMLQRLDRQDVDSKDFRDWLKREWKEFKEQNDAFRTDFDDMNARCKTHDDDLYGNQSKGKEGFIHKTDQNNNWIRKLAWTLGLSTSLGTAVVAWLVFFHGDDMKRGIFNPPPEQTQLIIDRRIKQWYKANGVQEPHWPQNAP